MSTDQEPWLERIQSYPLTHEHLVRADEAVRIRAGELRAEGDQMCFDLRAIAVISALSAEIGAEGCSAIMFRMEAMAKLLHRGELRKWTKSEPDADGFLLLNEALLHAVATAPLRRVSDRLSFDIADLDGIAKAYDQAQSS